MFRNPKKTILLAVVMAMAVSVSCSEVRYTDPVEMGITPYSDMPTKGYVPGTTMWDTQATSLHGLAVESPRKIWLTTWHYEATGGESEYFREEEFDYDPAITPTDGTKCWRRTPPVYWPIGGRIDFVGYSVTLPFAENQVSWSPGRSTDELVIDVSRPYTQDDILFGAAIGKRHADSTPGVAMVFDHAQAWLQFVLTSTDVASGVVTLDRIMVEDIYTTGRLTVTHDFGFAEGEWSFLYDTRNDTDVDDIHGVYGTKMLPSAKYCDMLIPEQKMKKNIGEESHIVIFYHLSGSDVEMQYAYVLPNATWQMGRKYVYEIQFNPHGIELLPSVTNWQGVPIATPITDEP